jgi:T5SS/PEP-CTERM-associated repeat protein
MKSFTEILRNVAALLLTSISVAGQTWDGGGANDNFSTPSNWDLDNAPVNNGSANVSFAGVIRTSPNLDVNYNIRELSFAAGSDSFIIGSDNGSILTIGAGGVRQNGNSPQRVNAPIFFTTFSSITANGDLHLAGSVAFHLPLTVAGSMSTTIERATGMGTGQLRKSGPGTLSFTPVTAPPDFPLVIDDGTVSYANAPNGVTFTKSVSLNGGNLSVMADMTLSGGQGQFARASGAGFTLQNGRTMTIENGADATFMSFYPTAPSAIYRVTGTGSTFRLSALTVASGARIEVLSGGALIPNLLQIGAAAGEGAIVIDGIGSRLTSTSSTGSDVFVGFEGGGSLTVRNGAVADIGAQSLAVSGADVGGTVSIENGAQLIAGDLLLGLGGGGSMTIQGVASKASTSVSTSGNHIGSDVAGAAPTLLNIKQGGELDVAGPLAVRLSGVVASSGPATLRARSGLTNSGQMNFTAGPADIFGSIDMLPGSRVITSGSGVTTFHDNFTHNGAEVRTNIGSKTVFLGAVTGSGPFNGSGEVDIEAGFSPGNSPAIVTSESMFLFGEASALTMEIGGLSAGVEYDKLIFAGQGVRFGGTLILDFIGGFLPEEGQTFDLFDFPSAAATGSFSRVVVADALPPNRTLNLNNLLITGEISVLPEPDCAFLGLLGFTLIATQRRRGISASSGATALKSMRVFGRKTAELCEGNGPRQEDDDQRRIITLHRK